MALARDKEKVADCEAPSLKSRGSDCDRRDDILTIRARLLEAIATSGIDSPTLRATLEASHFSRRLQTEADAAAGPCRDRNQVDMRD